MADSYEYNSSISFLDQIPARLSNIASFCSKCILYGMHYVTIITGKGKGILRNSVILWLKNNNQFVIEYFEQSIK